MNEQASNNITRFTAIFLMLFIATAVEVSQIYLASHIPDAFDITMYLVTMLVPSLSSSETESICPD